MSRRILFYDEETVHVDELVDRIRPFMDVEVAGDLCQRLDAEAYMPNMGEVRLLISRKADTKRRPQPLHEHQGPLPAMKLLKKSFERAEIEESFYYEIKNILRFGEQRFREGEAAIVHSHLALLTYSLLLILKKRMEARDQASSSNNYSIGDACIRVRDRCLVSICM